MSDASEFSLPDNLESIEADSRFNFDCGPDQPCFNRCCSQLNLQLTPYDCLRLTKNLELSPEEFLTVFASRSSDPDTGFPAFQLRMIESPDAPCPFVTPAGCSVYEDRPGACRSYPLGRGTRLGYNGVIERFFMIKEDHCAGFSNRTPRTPAEWIAGQGLEIYNQYNDKYMRLLSMVRAGGRPVSSRLVPMILLALWQQERFGEFLIKMNIPAQVAWDKDISRLANPCEDSGEALLDFGLDWLELVIFGQCPTLRRLPAKQD